MEIDNNDFLSASFHHTEAWNDRYTLDTDDEDYTATEAFQKWEAAYFSNNHITGSLRICHYGCAIYYLLIVKGNEAGHIWIDDRANDGGIYPVLSKAAGQKLSFIDWYGEWLNESIQALR